MFSAFCLATTEMLKCPFSAIRFSHSTAAVLVSDKLTFMWSMLTARQLPLYEFSALALTRIDEERILDLFVLSFIMC